jgi:hypothetical protein
MSAVVVDLWATMTRNARGAVFRVSSEFFYFLSAVLWGGAGTGYFSYLVERDYERRRLVFLITLELALWGLFFLVVSVHSSRYRERSEDAQPSAVEQIQTGVVVSLLIWFGIILLLSVSIYWLLR